jgi:hypothetical protein
MRIQHKARIHFINKGNTSAADANQAAQAAFYNQLTSNYQKAFGQFTALTNSLNSQIQPIIAGGPGQYGFTPAENAALNAGVINTASTNFKNQSVAQSNQIAAQSGGTGLPSGAQEQLTQQLGMQQAQGVSSAENAITTAGYAQGLSNYQSALGQEDSLISDWNPNNFASSATGGGQATTGAVNAATQADTAATAGIYSLVGAGLGGAASVLTAGYGKGGAFGCWIAEAIYGVDDIRTIELRYWLNTQFTKHWYGRAVMSVYLLIGRQVAWAVKRSTLLKLAITPLFNRALISAQAWLTKND